MSFKNWDSWWLFVAIMGPLYTVAMILFLTDQQRPEFETRCIAGVQYLRTRSSIDGYVLTPQFLADGKLKTCDENQPPKE